METVRYDVTAGVATITLDRPQSLNSMTDELMGDLVTALSQVEADPSVRVVVLTGAGRGFCSGADLSGFGPETPPQEVAEQSADSMDRFFNRAIRALADLPVPTIARIQGVAAGGGFGLALGCDISIAARSAWFVSTFGPRLGIVPDLGTTWHLPNRVGRARALGITLLGGQISAEQAAEWGLIWQVVDDDQLDAAVGEVAAQFARSSPDALVRIRRSIDIAATKTLSQQLDVERDHQVVLIPRNMAEGAAAFRERREPSFDGRRAE